jgi:hypothetical protein
MPDPATRSLIVCEIKISPGGALAAIRFRGAGVKTRAVKEHAFGLKLSAADRKALIAFLKTF